MRRVFVGGVIAMIVSISAAPSVAVAQCTASGAPDSCGVPGTVSMTAGRVVRLEMTPGSTSLTAPTTADFEAGLNSTNGPTLTVSANAAWTLHLRSSTAVWAATNTSPDTPARVNKPAGDLKWSTAPNGTFAALTTSDVSLVTGAAGANNVTTLFFETLYSWSLDTPGNYSLSIVLTLASP